MRNDEDVDDTIPQEKIDELVQRGKEGRGALMKQSGLPYAAPGLNKDETVTFSFLEEDGDDAKFYSITGTVVTVTYNEAFEDVFADPPEEETTEEPPDDTMDDETEELDAEPPEPEEKPIRLTLMLSVVESDSSDLPGNLVENARDGDEIELVYDENQGRWTYGSKGYDHAKLL